MKRITFPGFAKGLLAAAMLLPALAVGGGATALAYANTGAVYVLTNQVADNQVAAFDRAPDGSLKPAGVYSTGGQGTGAGLGSQNALVLSHNKQWLFAVNAGSNEISVFSVNPAGLTLVDREPSGGTDPISLSTNTNDHLLYVLNAGGDGSITGFTIGDKGQLTAIPGSTRHLSGSGVGPAEVQFSPNGNVLAVTEKATSLIDTYTVGKDGVAQGPVSYPAAGTTPFGFAFAGRNKLVVSEAFGGATDASAVSSYQIWKNGEVDVVSASIPTHQTAACWLVVTSDSRYAYTTDAGSGAVSGYAIAQDGSLSLLTPDGRTGVTGDGSHPIDMGLSTNNHYLYVLTDGSHGITTFAVNDDGTLTWLDALSGLPAGTVGIAVR